MFSQGKQFERQPCLFGSTCGFRICLVTNFSYTINSYVLGLTDACGYSLGTSNIFHLKENILK